MVDKAEAVGTVVSGTFVVAVAMLVAWTLTVATADIAVASNQFEVIVAILVAATADTVVAHNPLVVMVAMNEVETVMEVVAPKAMEVGS